MQIGELSRRTGVSVRMLRYYEDEGLLKPARRASGYRDFGAEDERIVRAIRQLSAAGLKLDFIRQFLPCLRSEGPILHPCPDLMAAMERQMRALTQDQTIERAKALFESTPAWTGEGFEAASFTPEGTVFDAKNSKLMILILVGLLSGMLSCIYVLVASAMRKSAVSDS